MKEDKDKTIEYAHPDLPELLEELGAWESEKNPGLWDYQITDDARAFVDFRVDHGGNSKGHRCAFQKDKLVKDVSNVPWLEDFKQRRDKLITSDQDKPTDNNIKEDGENQRGTQENQRMNTPNPPTNVSQGRPREAATATETQHNTPPPKIGNMIQGFTPVLQELGKIKIGAKGKTTTSKKGKIYRPPEKHEYFTIVTTEIDKNGDWVLDSNFPNNKPTKLNITLLYNDPSENFYTQYAAYTKIGRVCHGDGERAITSTSEIKTCNPSECLLFQERECKPNGILSVVLRDNPRLGGVYKFRTTSYNTIRNILSSMFLLQNRTGGLLAGIPLVLKISPQTTKTKTGITTTIHVVNLEFEGTDDELATATERARSADERMKGLHPTPTQIENETIEEIQDVADEFYPIEN